MKRAACLTVLVLLLAACENVFETQAEQELWNDLGINDYQFQYQVSCFCGFTGPNPALITVRNGKVTKVEYVDAPGPSVGTNGWPTIDSLFAIVGRARAARAAVLDVDFDDTYHYPKEINIDPVERTADDEITYRVQKFVPSVPGQ